MKPQHKAALIVIVAIALICLSVVAASYLITAPTSDPVTVTPAATLTKVAVSTQSLVAGSPLTLYTTISDSTPGLTVNFFNQNGAVGYATTLVNGTAILTINPPAGTWTYYASTTH